jgi:uncharacterized protein (DUF2235 family)
MGRNIVLCFDGTNNQYAATNTNVVKIYGMLDRTGNDQLAYYQPGIGTFAPPGVWEAGPFNYVRKCMAGHFWRRQ